MCIQIIRGIGSLYRLSSIAKAVGIGSKTKGTSIASQLSGAETRVLEAQIDYIQTLSDIGRISLYFAIANCIIPLSHHLLPAPEPDGLTEDEIPSIIRPLQWYMLIEGPDYLVSAWHQDIKVQRPARDVIYAAFRARNEEQRLFEQELVQILYCYLHESVTRSNPLPVAFNEDANPLGSPKMCADLVARGDIDVILEGLVEAEGIPSNVDGS